MNLIKQRFSVGGMACGACQAHVQKGVSALNGVVHANVNLLTKDMIVEYNPALLTEAQIIQKVKAMGFSAEPAEMVFDAQQEQRKQAADTASEITRLRNRFILSLIFLIPLSYLDMGAMVSLPQIPYFSAHPAVLAAVQLLLLLPILVLNRNYFSNGFNRLVRLAPNMDSLIAVGSGAGIFYSLWIFAKILQTGDAMLVHQLYFEAAGMIPVLITLGKYLETKSKGHTGDAIAALVSLSPQTASVERDGIEKTIPASQIRVGDVVILRSGSGVPVDGTVVEGNAMLDQSAITGESVPVEKLPGMTITSGSLCTGGFLKFRAEKTGSDTTLAKVIALVREAANSKAPVSRIADRVSAVFVPVVITIAIITFVCWLIFGGTVAQAVESAIAVLVISCPCALGLATPVAIMVGTGRAAELGLLFKSAESLETLHNVRVAVFDKTGTLTTGKPAVSDVLPASGETKQALLATAVSVETFSDHPYAKAICDFASKNQIQAQNSADFKAIPGKGITAQQGNVLIGGGNLAFLHDLKIDAAEWTSLAQKLADAGKTPLFFVRDNRCIGLLAISDTLRDGAAEAVSSLQKMHVRPVLLTGDNLRTANALAARIGIRKEDVFADVLPSDKEKIVRQFVESGNITAMIGDGINDAPALARADVGIAIGSGTDVAVDAADVVLAGNDPRAAVEAIRLSKAVIGNIRMNLFWAFFYNVLGIPFAAGVLYPLLGWQLSPMFGALAMSLSSVCVVTNALRLRTWQ